MATAKLIYKGLKANLPSSRAADSFYLVTDTRELYFGDNLYTEAVRFYTGSKPSAPAQGVLYVNESTGAGDAWDGSAWKSVFKGVSTAIGDAASDDVLPTEKAVKDYVDAQIDAIPAQTDYTVTVTESTPDGYAKAYKLTQNGKDITTINIPKDMVVESGKVVTDPEGQVAGTYIELTLANATNDKIYVNVGDLIEYVTSGSTDSDAIVIAVSDDHKVTASITDGSITLAKLDADTQAAIGKAHTHKNLELLETYTQTEADLADAVGKKHEHSNKTELDKIESGDKSKWDTAAGKAHEHDNKTVIDGITAEKVTAWDGAATNSHTHDNKTVLDGITAAKVDAWDAAEQNAKDYADDLDEAMDARVQVIEDAITVGTF